MRKLEQTKKWAIDYVHKNKKYIIIVSIIYFILFMGYFLFFLFYTNQVPWEAKILDWVESRALLLKTIHLSTILWNWWNNVLLFFIILVFGFAFSVGTIFYIFVDTSLFGLSLARFIQSNSTEQIYLILIHQFFSLPIILLALSLSLKLTISLYRKTFKKGDVKLLQEIKNVFAFYFLIVIPLFLISYIVEILVIKYLI